MKKPFYKSKTLWINVAILLLAVVDYTLKTGFISMSVFIVVGINILLRFITKKEITLFDDYIDEEI